MIYIGSSLPSCGIQGIKTVWIGNTTGFFDTLIFVAELASLKFICANQSSTHW
ncbi:hypothetical protein COLO4_36507 [Corchorus olitorius]|uniref:Uncharacterized protein n=1 Tax=Corchorus olitorius TaxID=93759 RepID=A0A1R3G8J7_9ROSI|nr:hypothetical protein COLO4_36507 [Corchorus olitorius]